MTDREATQEVITLCGEDGMAVRPPGNSLRANLMPFKVITTLGSCPEKRAVQRQGGHHARTRNHEAAVYRHRRPDEGSQRRVAPASALPRAGSGRARNTDL